MTSIDKKLIDFSSKIFYLIPLALLTGPFFSDLIVSIIALIFIYISIKEKKIKYYQNNFFYILVIFYIAINISALNSNFKINSLESSLFYWRYGIFSLATWYLIETNEKFIKNFTIFFIFIFSIVLFDSFYQFFNGNNIFGFNTDKANRLVLLLNDKVFLGGYLSRMLPTLIGLIIISFQNNKLITYIFICLLLISTDISIYLSGERTALGLILIASIMIIILINNFRILRIITLSVSIFSLILISIYSPEIKKRNIDRTYNQIFDEKKGDYPALFSVHHESHIITSWRMFKDKPLLGHGPNSFRKLCFDKKYKFNDLSCSTHPHNIYIQLLAEVGLLGTLIFMIIPLSLIYFIALHIMSFFTNNQHRFSDFQICIIASLTLTVFPFLPTQNFFNNYINVIFYLPVGFLLYTFYNRK